MDNNNKQNQNSNWQTITMLVIAALLTILIVGWMNSTVNARQRQELSYNEFVNMVENGKDQVEASLMSLFNEMQQLKDAMNAYDVPLMYRSLDLLKQALTEGQISLIEYFVETENIYKNLQAYMQIENQYQKVMANIYKNNL